MDKNKKLIQEAIMFAIDSVSYDIRTSSDEEANKTRAEAIKTLAEAYATVSGKRRGKE